MERKWEGRATLFNGMKTKVTQLCLHVYNHNQDVFYILVQLLHVAFFLLYLLQ